MTIANQKVPLRVLVVEDEMMVSMMIEETLVEAGYTVVGPYATVGEAVNAARHQELDAALLDVNIGGQMVFPVAGELSARGIPFGFATGYGYALDSKQWADRPILPKPFSAPSLENLMVNLMASTRPK